MKDAAGRRDAYRKVVGVTRLMITSPLRSVSSHLTAARAPETNPNVEIDVVVPCGHASIEHLVETVESVLAQTSAVHRLNFLAGAADPAVMSVCRGYVHSRGNVACIAGNTSSALEELVNDDVADWSLLIYPGARIQPDALATFKALVADEKCDFVYSDNTVVLSSNLWPVDTMYKPDYSPDLLRSYNYVGDCFLVRTSFLESLADELDVWNSHDTVLRLTESGSNIIHVQTALYSTPNGYNAKGLTSESAIAGHLRRVGLTADIEPGKVDGTFRMRYAIEESPLVSIIIPNKDHVDDLRRCIDSIRSRSAYRNFEIIVVENNSTASGTFAYYDELESSFIRVVKYVGEFNYSAVNNFGVLSASGDYLLFLNNDTEVVTERWLDELLMYAQRADVGAVGGKLYFEDGRIQHAGLVLGVGGVAANAGRLADNDDDGYMARYSVAQDISGVTGACLMTRAGVFHEVGGFNEDFPVDFNDVDYCLSVRKAGYRIVYNPYCQLNHYESATRSAETASPGFGETVLRFQDRWAHELSSGDPYYNVNLDQDSPNYELNESLSYLTFGRRPSAGIDESGLSIAQRLDEYFGSDNVERSMEVVNYRRRIRRDAEWDGGLSVVILNLNKPDLINPLLDSLVEAKRQLAMTGLDIEIIVGDTGSTDRSVLDHYEELHGDVEVVRDMKYQFSRCNNEVFDGHVSKSVTLFLNNDVIFDDPVRSLGSIYRELISDERRGVAGSYLYFPDMSVQHKGINFFWSGEAESLPYHPGHGESSDVSQAEIVETAPAVTGAFLMIKSALFAEIDGFDDGYEEECQDVALCLSARRLGFEIVVARAGIVFHLENATRPTGSENWADRRRLMRKWKLYISEVLHG